MDKCREITIEPMVEGDIEESVKLINAAMNEDEADWARETFELYFKSRKQGIDSGREYYLWRDDGKIYGLVGLHRYVWGPGENVWLSWFAVHPERQKEGVGGLLLDSIKEKAVQKGYRKLFVETYSGDTFEKARSFYKGKGFSEVGRIENYLPDGSSMIVFGLNIG
ncbi:MAG: GNAT family N-acetyltransferase [Sedimentisphaerales bacterium]|nr:GNAT family N-acetyltransferase [Sedimentisphaerales bacterium]